MRVVVTRRITHRLESLEQSKPKLEGDNESLEKGSKNRKV